MMWVLMCFIAIAVGFMMFADVQPHIPDELAFLRNDTPAVVQPAAVPQPVAIEHGWQLRGEAGAQELFKRFSGGAEVSGAVYEAPTLAFMCDGKQLHARIDAVARTTGLDESEVVLGGKAAVWPKAQGNNLLAPNATALLRQLTKNEGPVQVGLSYVELGAHSLTFDTQGLRAAAEVFPAECR
jgi:hypothetical protein